MNKIEPVLYLVLVVLALVAPAGAQCFGDDGFSIPGTCCVPNPAISLPAFPAISLPSEGCCFYNCDVEAVFPTTINLGAPIPIFCDIYAIPITISGMTSPTYLVGHYQRTWQENDPLGISFRQVWRFLVNGDLTYVSPFNFPCSTPSCVQGNLPVHFTGSIDYAQDCFFTTWEAAINLTHLCGDYSHGPTTSRQTPFDHPYRSYAFVGPAPFDFAAPATPPTGNIYAESVRSTDAYWPTFQWDCYSELPVWSTAAGDLQNVAMTCPCYDPSDPWTARWAEQTIRFDYGCNGPQYSFQSLPWFPLAPSGLQAFPLGTYTGSILDFPGNRSVTTYFGVASSPDPCAGNFPLHLVHGVATSGGDYGLFFNPITPVAGSQTFLDLANMKVLLPTPPNLFIGHGQLFLSTMSWSVNM